MNNYVHMLPCYAHTKHSLCQKLITSRENWLSCLWLPGSLKDLVKRDRARGKGLGNLLHDQSLQREHLHL